MKKLIITIVLIAVLTSCQKETPHQIKEDEGYASIEITEVTMPSIVSSELEDVDFKKVINYEDVWVASYIDEGVSKILVFNEQGNIIYLQSNSSGSFSITQDKNDIYQLSYKNDLSQQDYLVFTEKSILKGDFSESNYSLRVNGDFWINNINTMAAST